MVRIWSAYVCSTDRNAALFKAFGVRDSFEGEHLVVKGQVKDSDRTP